MRKIGKALHFAPEMLQSHRAKALPAFLAFPNFVLRPALLPSIKRAAHPKSALMQDVRVNHRRAHVTVPEELLDGADVIAGLQ